MNINKIAIIASADASKPEIILNTLMKYKLIEGYSIVFFTIGYEGKCIDLCNKYDIKVINLTEPHLKTEDDIEKIRRQNCDILISMGWPYLIPGNVLSMFKKSINCHGSILPDYRGSRAYMHYYANCEQSYGATIHYMNERFDDGRVIVQGGYRTSPNEDNNDMHIRTAELCAFLLPNAIHMVEQDWEGYIPDGQKRYFYKLSPEEFQEYRKYNIKAKSENRPLKLTPHKIIEN